MATPPYSDSDPTGGKRPCESYSDFPPPTHGSKWSPGDELIMDFPATVAAVKTSSPNHTAFEDTNLADDFAFKTWCLLVPRPIADPSEASTSVSLFLTENREAFGNMLPDHVLLLTRTKGGTIDRGFASSVATAMQLGSDDFPVLMFFKVPKVVIRMRYENRALLDLKDDVLNGFALTLGGADIAAAKELMTKLPDLLQFEKVPVDDLIALVARVEKEAKSRWLKSKAKGIAMPAVKVIGTLGRVAITGGA
jgi:hypothetical protein